MTRSADLIARDCLSLACVMRCVSHITESVCPLLAMCIADATPPVHTSGQLFGGICVAANINLSCTKHSLETYQHQDTTAVSWYDKHMTIDKK